MVKPEKLPPAASSENQQLFSQKNAQVEREKDFKILEELGRNSLAGRTTFKAQDNRTDEIVVIKKFQFLSNSWDGYKLIEKRFVNAQTAKKALVELKNKKSSSFLSKDDEEKSESSLFKILPETEILVYLPVVIITFAIFYYVLSPFINSIIS